MLERQMMASMGMLGGRRGHGSGGSTGMGTMTLHNTTNISTQSSAGSEKGDTVTMNPFGNNGEKTKPNNKLDVPGDKDAKHQLPSPSRMSSTSMVKDPIMTNPYNQEKEDERNRVLAEQSSAIIGIQRQQT